MFRDFEDFIVNLLYGSALTVGSAVSNGFLEESGSGNLFEAITSSSATTGDSASSILKTGNLSIGAASEENPVAGTTVIGGTIGSIIWSGGEYSLDNTPVDLNSVPYSQVEKRAQQTYNVLHGRWGEQYKFPAIVIESPAVLKMFTDVFGENPSLGKLTEKIDVLEMVLERWNEK